MNKLSVEKISDEAAWDVASKMENKETTEPRGLTVHAGTYNGKHTVVVIGMLDEAVQITPSDFQSTCV